MYALAIGSPPEYVNGVMLFMKIPPKMITYVLFTERLFPTVESETRQRNDQINKPKRYESIANGTYK